VRVTPVESADDAANAPRQAVAAAIATAARRRNLRFMYRSLER
jgi:hypothetical protein